jgi:hypothetical protein
LACATVIPMNITIAEWTKRHKLKKRDAYRILEQKGINPVKELRQVVQKRKIWVMCIDESVNPD